MSVLCHNICVTKVWKWQQKGITTSLNYKTQNLITCDTVTVGWYQHAYMYTIYYCNIAFSLQITPNSHNNTPGNIYTQSSTRYSTEYDGSILQHYQLISTRIITSSYSNFGDDVIIDGRVCTFSTMEIWVPIVWPCSQAESQWLATQITNTECSGWLSPTVWQLGIRDNFHRQEKLLAHINELLLCSQPSNTCDIMNNSFITQHQTKILITTT